MFRNALNVMVLLPRARLTTFASIPQTFQRTITTVDPPQTPWIGDHEPVGFEDVSRRFKDLKTQTAYDHLIRYIGFERTPGRPHYKPDFHILASPPPDRTLTYVWEYDFERVLIMVYVPDDDDDDVDELEADSSPVRAVVNTFRCDCVHLGFGIRVFHREMKVDYVSYGDENRPHPPPRHHVFNFRHLDGDTQAACYKLLESRGILPGLDYQKKHVLELYHTHSQPQGEQQQQQQNTLEGSRYTWLKNKNCIGAAGTKYIGARIG